MCMFAFRFAYCNQALVFKSPVSVLRYRLTDCHSLGDARGGRWQDGVRRSASQQSPPSAAPEQWCPGMTSCSSVWRQARVGSPSGWTSPPRAACSLRPKAERILLIVQEQRGIIKPPAPPPSTSNCCSAGIQTHPESRWSSGPAST